MFDLSRFDLLLLKLLRIINFYQKLNISDLTDFYRKIRRSRFLQQAIEIILVAGYVFAN